MKTKIFDPIQYISITLASYDRRELSNKKLWKFLAIAKETFKAHDIKASFSGSVTIKEAERQGISITMKDGKPVSYKCRTNPYLLLNLDQEDLAIFREAERAMRTGNYKKRPEENE